VGRGLRAIIWKELIQLRRDPFTLALLFFVPMLQLTLFGYAIDMDVKHIPTAVLDEDNSRMARELIEALTSTATFRVARRVDSERALRAALIEGSVRVGVKIPSDYSANLMRGRRAEVLVLIDGSDSQVGLQALNNAIAVGLQRSLPKAKGKSPRHLAIDMRPRMLFNPQMKSANFFVPGLVGIIMQMVTVLLTAFAIVRERERGTLEQLMVTPIDPTAVILGKLIPYGGIGLLTMMAVLVIMRWVFGVPIHGSLGLLVGLSLFFLLASLALGMLISTVAENQLQAVQLSFLFLLPSILLSGFVFPRESMPTPIYILTFLVPVTYFLEILRGIILRGAGLGALVGPVCALGLISATLVIASVARFRKRAG